MKKIKVEQLIFEVTRKCNMACEHCLRGNAQSCNMTKDIVDKVLDQVDVIDTVIFTGGEPTLNIEIIDYIVQGIIKRKIEIEGFYIVSNGKKVNYELPITLLYLYSYICKVNNGLHDEEYSQFQVSVDEFHDETEDDNFSFYRGLSFFSVRKNDYSYGLINMGLASENFSNDREYKISMPKVSLYNGKLRVKEVLYINAKGGVLTDCNLSYEIQETHTYGNINKNSLYDILIDWVEKENENVA